MVDFVAMIFMSPIFDLISHFQVLFLTFVRTCVSNGLVAKPPFVVPHRFTFEFPVELFLEYSYRCLYFDNHDCGSVKTHLA